MVSDGTRFTFRLDSASAAGLIRVESPDCLVGQEVPVRWGDEQAMGRVERVDADENGVRVTLAIDRPLGFLDISLPVSKGSP